MFAKPSTLVIVFLLLSAASLASYLFHQWNIARGGTLGWTGVSLGATLLLAAVVVVVLALSWLSAHQWSIAEISQTAPARSVDAKEGGWAAVGYVGDSVPEQPPPSEPGRSEPGRTQAQSQAAPRIEATGVNDLLPWEPPWAATQCVSVLNPDPADPTRWRFDNGCQGAVAILVATCSGSDAACLPPGSPNWQYQDAEMFLPWKLQRPVTADEETRRGVRIRYVACSVRTRLALGLIGAGSDERASSEWAERFAAARYNDECLTQVRTGLEAGRASSLAIDVPPGRDVPELAP